MRGVFGLLLLMLLGQPALAAALDGEYRATLDGMPTELHLRSQGNAVDGLYIENGSLRLNVRGTFDGQRLDAQILDGSGQPFATLQGTYANDSLNARIAARDPRNGNVVSRDALFQRPTARQGASTATSVSGQLDPALVGTWLNEKMINSGGASFASFTTVMTLRLNPDGSVAQWSRSVGGGENWNYDSPGTLQYSGAWYTDNGTLMVRLQGQNTFQPAARYRFSDQYLVTEGNTGKVIWKRP